jgi:predicted house-cleaning noncanonical NTP pyrophosphatase (MazG superfamily)
MAIKKYKFAKLVRDNIVKDIQKIGNRPIYKVLNDDEYISELLKKLLEEANEITSSPKDELLGELSDIQEIIDNLIVALNISKHDLQAAQDKKNSKAGSFKEKLYIDYVETDSESEWGKFYSKNSHKYPEIKE